MLYVIHSTTNLVVRCFLYISSLFSSWMHFKMCWPQHLCLGSIVSRIWNAYRGIRSLIVSKTWLWDVHFLYIPILPIYHQDGINPSHDSALYHSHCLLLHRFAVSLNRDAPLKMLIVVFHTEPSYAGITNEKQLPLAFSNDPIVKIWPCVWFVCTINKRMSAVGGRLSGHQILIILISPRGFMATPSMSRIQQFSTEG